MYVRARVCVRERERERERERVSSRVLCLIHRPVIQRNIRVLYDMWNLIGQGHVDLE